MTTTAPTRSSRIARWRTVRAQRAEHLRRMGRLTTRTRAALMSLGTAMVAAGGWAVFKTKVEAGPTALITIGALLVVLGAMGRQIASMNLKDGSMTMQDVKDEVNQADSPEQVVDAIVNAPGPVQSQLQRDEDITMMSEAAYEKSVAGVLAEYFGDAVQRDVPIGSTRADIVVTLDGKRAVVETRLGNPSKAMPPEVLRRLVRPDYLNDDDVHAIVIVSASEPGLYFLGEARERAVQAGKNFTFASWAGSVHNRSLKQAIEDQLRG
ncbi:hypothetical protein [Streptomyces echinatus]|uniref:hypothetical protein n=1 Tax=Streptomyces echinatus TaxID=67293 RepID=UPI0038190B46